ncbi:LuxR family transcriptional regulator [Enterobacteriaceae bacterium 89]|nr:LuxR family transcriptional regulator [Enterobacteriaceae bacterium 89]
MSRYNIHYLSPKSVWLQALDLGFTQLARTNPGWSYAISTGQGNAGIPDLYVLDLTTANEINVDALPVNHSKMLVLIQASQKKLIRHIYNETRCSLLCIDEHALNFRNIVEASIRNKRFISTLIQSLLLTLPVTAPETPLTDTEHKILEYLREGKNGVEISQLLFRSQKTISSHKRNIMRKFGVSDDLGLKQKIIAMEEMACLA